MPQLLIPPQGKTIMNDLTRVGLPDIPLLGMHNPRRAQAGLQMHVHPGRMEICYLVRGEQIYRVGGRDYPIKGNEIFWTHPDEKHGSGRNIHGKGLLYWMHVRLPRRPQPFLALQAREAWPLAQQLRALPQRSFRGVKRLQVLFEDAWRLYYQPEGPLARLQLAGRLTEWLLLVATLARKRSLSEQTDDIAVVRALVDEHPSEAFSVDQMAEHVHLSTSRFKAKFKEQVGMPPHEYLLRSKIRCAERMLKAGGRSITAVAYELGFSSSQCFATVFKRFTNLRPSDVVAHQAGK